MVFALILENFFRVQSRRGQNPFSPGLRVKVPGQKPEEGREQSDRWGHYYQGLLRSFLSLVGCVGTLAN